MVWVKTLQIDVFMHFDFISYFFLTAKYVQGIKYPLIRLDTKNDKEKKLRLQKLILQF